MRKILIFVFLIFCNKVCFCIDSSGLPVGASAMALGEAWTGEASDVWASWWNPAGLVQIKDERFALMHQKVMGIGISFDYFGYVKGKIDKSETYGIFISRLDYGKDLEYNWFEDFIYLSYAKKEDKKISYGGNLKYLRVRTVAGKGSGYSLDAGILYKIDENLKAGLMLRDVFSQINYTTGTNENLPVGLSLGISYRVDPVSLFVLDFSGEKEIESDMDPTWGMHFGYERWIDETIALRGGYLYRNVGENTDYEKRFTVGIGLRLGPWDIDYAYNPLKSIPGVEDAHKISVVYKLK